MAVDAGGGNGFWGPRTASEDWCEANYVYTQYVAEFWNVVSSIPIVLTGIFGVWAALTYGYRKRFLVPSMLTILVGVGSISFHGTLQYWGQALDELAMVWCVTAMVYFTIDNHGDKQRTRPWIAWALAVFAALFTAFYWYAKEGPFFVCFVVLFASMSVYVMWGSYQLHTRTTCLPLRRLYFLGNITWALSFLVFWLPDKLLCSHTQGYQLHAVFHVLSALAPWWYLCHAVHCFYNAQLARRTGLVAAADGTLVKAGDAMMAFVRQQDAGYPAPPASPPTDAVALEIPLLLSATFTLPFVALKRKSAP